MSGEFGGLPRVTINGREFGQSMATLRMLGSMNGLYDPSDWKCAAYVDSILDCWVDLHDKSYQVAMFMPNASDEERMAKMTEIIDKLHEPCFKYMEGLLTKHNGPYIAGTKLSIGDIALMSFLESMWECPGGPFVGLFKPVIAKYPKVKMYFSKLRATFCETIKRVIAPKQIQVEYFGSPPGLGYARAGPIRFLLTHANKRFKFTGYDFPTWGAIKQSGKSGEFGGLPRVTMNGQEFGQSMASLRMLGIQNGYYDPSDWQ